MKILLLWLLLADDPLATSIDTMTRAMGGYNVRKEAAVVGDEVFLLRLTADLVGALPTEDEIAAFVKSPDPGKRERKIGELLADARFGGFWAQRFSKAFFGDAEKVRWTGIAVFPEGYESARVARFTAWLAGSLNQDRPWTDIVARMLEARGSAAADPALAYQLSFHRGKGLPREFAEGVSRDFLGIRLGCARCHDHPFDKWRTEDYFGLAAFVARQRAEVKDGEVVVRTIDSEEMILAGIGDLNPVKGEKPVPVAPNFLFGGKPGSLDDRMKFLSQLMTMPANSQLPRALANRVWGWLMGRGIVQPVDDFNLKNKALSPALLEAMTRDLVDHGYSIKRLVRSIALSAQYQMPTPAEMPDAESFRHLGKRKMPILPYIPAAAKPALEFKAPAAWTGVKDRNGSKGLYVIADPADPTRYAEIGLYPSRFAKDNAVDPSRQIVSPVSTTQKVEGKVSVTFVEHVGQYWCQRGGEGPVDYRLWVASLEIGKTPWHFRATGPGDLLDPHRGEFVEMLQSLVDPAR